MSTHDSRRRTTDQRRSTDVAPAGGQPPRTAGTIVVLGGYGAVGGGVARTLATWFPGEVVVAGRDGDRAAAFAAASGGTIAARKADVTRRADVDRVLDGARVVVMCVERANAAVARACLRRGIHYVDISATDAVLSAVASLDGIARAHAATAVLSVGLAPGLTNLLARACHERLPAATHIDITLIAGVDNDHGPDAVRWIVDGLVAREATVGRGPLRVDLPGFGVRSAHPFPFSDQHTVTRSLGVPATTRLAFEPAALTRAIFALRAAGVAALLRGPRGRRLLTALLSRVRFGTDRFVVHVAATDAAGRRVSLAASGRGESAATAVIAAHVARLVGAGDAPAGVIHIDDLPGARGLLPSLPRHGIVLHERMDPAPAHAGR